jgi:hypothetical protein
MKAIRITHEGRSVLLDTGKLPREPLLDHIANLEGRIERAKLLLRRNGRVRVADVRENARLALEELEAVER